MTSVLASVQYVELEARSCFSFLSGASQPRTLIEEAARLGYGAIAVADRDGLYGMVRAHEAAKEHNVRLIVGCELTLGEAPPHATLLVYVESAVGYRNLCRILTRSHALHPRGRVRSEDEGVPHNCFAGVSLDFVCENAEGLFALVDARALEALGQPDALDTLKHAFGDRLSLRIVRHLDGSDDAHLKHVLRTHERTGIAICATNAVRHATANEKPLYDVLHCIREGITLDDAGRSLAPNAEARLKSASEMHTLFRDHPEWLARSCEIANACTFRMTDLAYRFPSELDDDLSSGIAGESPDEALRRLSYEGARVRYPRGVPESVAIQVEKELSLIAQRAVAPFFLSVKRIVEMARRRDILCQGRGSAANSAVCYCLGITAVDPARSNLLFERFLSLDRDEPPDIDVDFEHERREEVIQEIYDRYGRDRAAMVSEVIRYRPKSALRDAGKTFGLPLDVVDKLSGLFSWWDAFDEPPETRLRDAGLDPADPRLLQTLRIAKQMQGLPRHLSIHVGGFVLSSEPLEHVAPVEPATMPGRTIIPWDKDDIDTLGFFKVDVLALGMLTAIRKALRLAEHDPRVGQGSAIEQLARIPPEDPAVYDALCKADSIGVFQVESRAQMSMLPRLKPRRFYDLVVQVAIVRPGPIQGGMVHPYLRRRAGLEASEAPHPILEQTLERTLGVPLFQEQVMQLAIVGAGYTGGEADQLRRDMAAWRKSGNLERHREKLTRGFVERGVPLDFAERLYSQIEGFGEYGFPESHAASFALLVYASSWLKVHHPAAFAASLINSQPMGFYSPSAILQDAQRHGITLLPIDVMHSDWDCTLVDARTLRIGLRLVKGLGREVGERIAEERRAGLFVDLEDLAERTGASRKHLEALAESGALEALAGSRREALWQVHAPRGQGLFAGLAIDSAHAAFRPLTRSEQLSFDYSRTGLSIGDHPMKLARAQLPSHVLSSRDIASDAQHGKRAAVAGLVTCRQRPATASGIVFLSLEDEHGTTNVLTYERVFERYREAALHSSMLCVRGRIEHKEGVTHLIAEHLEPLVLKDLELASMSRDFH